MLPDQRRLQFRRIAHVIRRKTCGNSQMHDVAVPHALHDFADGGFCQTQTKGIAHRAFIGRATAQQ